MLAPGLLASKGTLEHFLWMCLYIQKELFHAVSPTHPIIPLQRSLEAPFSPVHLLSLSWEAREFTLPYSLLCALDEQ